MGERRLTRNQVFGISAAVGLLAGVVQAWVLYTWLGLSFWFFALVVPACMITVQAVAGPVAVALHKQFGDPNTPLLPRS